MIQSTLIGKEPTDDIVALYERDVLGMWTNCDAIKKKEGNKMIESMNLIDLYANKHIESIEKETKNKIDELKKDCDVINKFNELVEQFDKDCDELYLSQFPDEEKNRIVTERSGDDTDMPLRRNFNSSIKYRTNSSFKPDGFDELNGEVLKRIAEISDLIKTVKAHIGIAKTKEEVEEILTRYGIIDKRGKLVLE